VYKVKYDLLGTGPTSELSQKRVLTVEDLLVYCPQRPMWNMQVHRFGINCQGLHPLSGPATHSLVPSLCCAGIPW